MSPRPFSAVCLPFVFALAHGTTPTNAGSQALAPSATSTAFRQPSFLLVLLRALSAWGV